MVTKNNQEGKKIDSNKKFQSIFIRSVNIQTQFIVGRERWMLEKARTYGPIKRLILWTTQEIPSFLLWRYEC